MSFFRGVIQDKHIAILFFSRSAHAEAKAKRWLPEAHFQQNTRLASYLINKSQYLLQSAGLPVFHFNEYNQTGNCFGERIANAFESIFNQGFESVICLGNDAPSIQKLNWKHIQLNLDQGKNVIGPDRRNGAYLIGIHKSNFHKERFKNLSWQTSRLLDQLIALGSTALLNRENDLNDLRDVKSLINLLRPFKKLIQSLTQKQFDLDENHAIIQLSYNLFGLRAPPVLV